MSRYSLALGKAIPKMIDKKSSKKKPNEFGGGVLGGQLETTVCREVETVAQSGNLVLLSFPSIRAARRFRNALQFMGVRPLDRILEEILLDEGRKLARKERRKNANSRTSRKV